MSLGSPLRKGCPSSGPKHSGLGHRTTPLEPRCQVPGPGTACTLSMVLSPAPLPAHDPQHNYGLDICSMHKRIKPSAFSLILHPVPGYRNPFQRAQRLLTGTSSGHSHGPCAHAHVHQSGVSVTWNPGPWLFCWKSHGL